MTNIKYLMGVLITVLILTQSAYARPFSQAKSNVILLMLDGVRWQEMFYGEDAELSNQGGAEIFSFLHKEYAREGVLFGDKNRATPMTVSNEAYLSLPGYQSIMAGTTQNCSSNSCGRIRVETVQERLVRDLHLDKREVATIASWEKIPYAVEQEKGSAFVNAAFEPLRDGTSDAVFEKINKEQSKNTPPWGGARFDRYTFAHGFHYLQKHRPRFMFLSLNDSDEWAHRNEYSNYVGTLRQYDTWIRELITWLNQSGEYGQNTTLIITTDHGRGDGGQWGQHGMYWTSAKYIWLYGRSAATINSKATARAGYTHIDIRPTIEAAMGLKPVSCKTCGRVIREIVPVRRKWWQF